MKSTTTLALIFIINIIINQTIFAQDFEWAKKIGGNGDDRGRAIAFDKNENIYTTGTFKNTADFDSGIGTFNLNSQGGTDVFISKLDANGNFIWAKSIGGIYYNDISHCIAIDSFENLFILLDILQQLLTLILTLVFTTSLLQEAVVTSSSTK